MRRRALLVVGLVAVVCAPLACRKRGRAPRFSGTTPPGAGGLHFVYEVDFSRAFEAGSGREALLARTVDVLRRRVDQLTSSGEVRPLGSGSGVEVFLPAEPPALREAFRRVARLPGRFQVLLVDNDSPYMKTLAERARGPAFERVSPAADAWTAPNGAGTRDDVFLRASDRAALIAAVDKLTAEVPLASNRAIVLEKWNDPDAEGAPGGTRWRTYYVEKVGGLSNGDIASAAPGRSFDGRPDVQVVLTAQGRKTFGEMTTQGVGRKIAVVLDGEVQTAPVVASPIPNGRVHIMTGSSPSLDPALLNEEVEDFALVLNSGPLPAPIRLMVEEPVQSRPGPAPR